MCSSLRYVGLGLGFIFSIRSVRPSVHHFPPTVWIALARALMMFLLLPLLFWMEYGIPHKHRNQGRIGPNSVICNAQYNNYTGHTCSQTGMNSLDNVGLIYFLFYTTEKTPTDKPNDQTYLVTWYGANKRWMGWNELLAIYLLIQGYTYRAWIMCF